MTLVQLPNNYMFFKWITLKSSSRLERARAGCTQRRAATCRRRAAVGTSPGALGALPRRRRLALVRPSPMAIGAAVVALVCVFCALFADVVAPHNPFDLATLELADSMLPPAWMDGGTAKYLLGTDEQGRDMLSALMYGARISLLRRRARRCCCRC